MIVSDEVKIVLPFPPSLNRYYRNVRGMVKISAEGREYKKLVRANVLAQIPDHTMMTGRVEVAVKTFQKDKRRRDLDNTQKALLDALSESGAAVYQDDSQIDGLYIQRKGVDRENPRVEVLITEIGE